MENYGWECGEECGRVKGDIKAIIGGLLQLSKITDNLYIRYLNVFFHGEIRSYEMINYVTKEIDVEQLILDEQNPRFIVPPNPSQQSIVDYLIDYEEVVKLAMSIRDNGGLFAGERVIVYEEDEKYVVLEGNRRVCACKILLNPNLLSNRKPATIGTIEATVTNSLKEAINKISVDIMPNRISAQSSLAAKHIEGIKRWSTISKYKFVSLEFDAGRSIEEISRVTGLTQTKIKSGLKEYRLIDYALRLGYWTEQEREKYLDLQEIKTSRFTRLFSAKTNDENKLKLREIIGLDYDDKYQILTDLDKESFDNIIFIVAQAAFNPEYCPEFNTRSTYEDIPQLMKYFKDKNINVTSREERCDKSVVSANKVDNESKKDVRNHQGDIDEENKLNNGKKSSTLNNTNKSKNSDYTSKRNVLIPNDFNVTCKVIKINDIICELKKLNFNYCVNAQAVLLRVLVELSVKYYLNKNNEKEKIDEQNLDGTYSAALESIRKRQLISHAEHKNLTQIRKKEQVFNVFNGYVHYDSVVPNRDILIYYFDNLRKLIEICLNS